MHNYCEDYLQNEFYTGYMVLFQGMKKSETLLEIYKKKKNENPKHLNYLSTLIVRRFFEVTIYKSKLKCKVLLLSK